MAIDREKNKVLQAAEAIDNNDRLVKDGGPKVDTTVIPPYNPDANVSMPPTLNMDFETPFINGAEEDFKEGLVDHRGPELTNMPRAASTDGRKVGLKNAGEGVNPKDRVGASKVDMTIIPPTAMIHCALALMDGATKYGPYNWRVEPIQARTYIAAIMRHCMAYLDGEATAPDSGILHMAHIMANAAILLDADYQQKMSDDRPIVPQTNATASVQLQAAHDWIKKYKQPGWGR